MFLKEDFGIKRKNKRQLDAIALEKGGVVGSIGYGYSDRCETAGETIHGYGLKWINKQGMGNHGTLILVPKSANAKECLRQGFIKKLMNEFGVKYQVADAYCSASNGVSYSRESEVIEHALMCIDNKAAWESAIKHTPGNRRELNQWLKAWGVEFRGSYSRWKSALGIVKKMIDSCN